MMKSWNWKVCVISPAGKFVFKWQPMLPNQPKTTENFTCQITFEWSSQSWVHCLLVMVTRTHYSKSQCKCNVKSPAADILPDTVAAFSCRFLILCAVFLFNSPSGSTLRPKPFHLSLIVEILNRQRSFWRLVRDKSSHYAALDLHSNWSSIARWRSKLTFSLKRAFQYYSGRD